MESLNNNVPSQDEITETLIERHTKQVQERLAKGKVAIAGLGGLGSNIAVSLARVGVGNLLLIDFDVVELSNLNRQNYYIQHLGLPKTEALKQQLLQINPYIQIETKNLKIEEANVVDVFKGYEIVCEAFDRPEYKAILINTILEKLPDTKVVSGSGLAGYLSSNAIKTRRRMKNFYLCGDLENGVETGFHLMAPRVQICAGHQANMITRLLLGIEEV